LEKHSTFNTKAAKIIIELNKIALAKLSPNMATNYINPQKRNYNRWQTLFLWKTLLCITSYSRLLVC